MASAAADRDWSKLVEDLLIFILQRLHIPDILRSAAVCTTWCSVVRELRRQRRPIHESPWLMIRDIVDGRPMDRFYSFSEKRCYTIPLAYDANSDCIYGSSHGWLIIADKHSNLYLLNPITGAQNHDLPPAATLDFVEAIDGDESGPLQGYQVVEGTRAGFYHPHVLLGYSQFKAILSSSPSDEHFAIMMVARSFAKVVFARAGDKRWTTIVSGVFCQDIAFHNGEFYLMTCTGVMQVFDHNGSQKASVRLWPLEQDLDYLFFLGCKYLNYLVPCSSGDIMLVRRLGFGPYDFRVFTIHLHQDKKLVDLESSENYAFFLDYRDSMCLSCIEFPELRSNCIYVNGDVFVERIGTYNVEDGIFQSYENPGHQIRGSTTTPWIIPSLR